MDSPHRMVQDWSHAKTIRARGPLDCMLQWFSNCTSAAMREWFALLLQSRVLRCQTRYPGRKLNTREH